MVIAEVLMNGDDELRQLMQAAVDKYMSMIEAQLAVGIQKGEVRPDVDLKAAALQFYGLIQAVNTLNHFESEELPVGNSKMLWQVFTRGVSDSSVEPSQVTVSSDNRTVNTETIP